MDENKVEEQNTSVNQETTQVVSQEGQVTEQTNKAEATQTEQTAPKVEEQSTIKPAPEDPSFSPNNYIKKNKNKKMIIIIGAIVVVVIAFLLINNKMPSFNNKNSNVPGEENKIIVETGKGWGDAFALYIQDFFVERDTIDLAFLDVNFDETPEMVLKFNDKNNKEVIMIMQYANNEVSESKEFRNASFKLIYSLQKKDVKWYLFINSMTKYGSYTDVAKIVNGTALDSDIKYTNDKEVAAFNNNYVGSDFKFIYFPIEKKSFEDDFKNAVSNYDNTNVNEEIKRLKEEYKDKTGEVEKEDTNPTFNVGEYSLAYGRYYIEVDVYTNGVVTGTEKRYITINRNRTMTVNNEVITFQVFGSSVSLSNGVTFTVTGNNAFSYGSSAYIFEQ